MKPAGETSAGTEGPKTEVLAMGENHHGVDVHVEGPASLVFARSTIQPGGSTGWHFHSGPVLVAIQSGTLTRYDAEGNAHVHPPGESIIEPAGETNVHMGANHGTESVVLLVTYVVPSGAPLSIEGCPSAVREPRSIAGDRGHDDAQAHVEHSSPSPSVCRWSAS
ncbi:MAG TPA: cupin domain-containing protein [Acidimicrobiales bacterium]|nr:cupin domain-containing protein [Acidimicrobiales bacterium]